MRWNKLASPLFALLLFAGLSTTFWIHRVHVERPELRRLILNADAFIYFYPAAVFLQNELRRGELPLWNPYQLAGQPFVALHAPGALYPPNLVLLSALSVEHALQVHVVLHLMLAGFFTWLLAARLGLEPIPRFVAAVGWMLSGPMLWSIYLPPFLSTQA